MARDAVSVQLVPPDGTIVRNGLRVRLAPGVGEGSLVDEYFWDVKTPLLGDEVRDELLRTVNRDALAAFVRALPVARVRPKGSELSCHDV